MPACRNTQIHRLPFLLHDFTRTCWVSDRARAAWLPRMQKIIGAWEEIEWRTVQAGMRACAVQFLSPEAFVQASQKWAREGLCAFPIDIQGQSDGYTTTPVPMSPNKPIMFRCVIGATEAAATFIEALKERDSDTMGQLLGYPQCCQEFFRQVWVEDGLIDTTWPMACASSDSGEYRDQIEVDASWHCNVLWRWMGLRCVAHLPCGFDCKATIEIANRFIESGREWGFEAEADWLLEILSWPVEWSALHGIAEIKTPLLKASTRTDATASKYTVRYRGTKLPPESASGLNFPFKISALPILTSSLPFKRGIDNPIVSRPETESWYFKDNQFTSIQGMNDAHEAIIQVSKRILTGGVARVLDLGCGNGALLKRLGEMPLSIEPYGVDLNAHAIDHAKQLHPAFSKNFIAGDMFKCEEIWDNDMQYDIIVIMPGRLLEIGPTTAKSLVERLAHHSRFVLAYAYGDWLTKFGKLEALCSSVGLRMVAMQDGLGLDERDTIDSNASVISQRCAYSEAGLVAPLRQGDEMAVGSVREGL